MSLHHMFGSEVKLSVLNEAWCFSPTIHAQGNGVVLREEYVFVKLQCEPFGNDNGLRLRGINGISLANDIDIHL